MSQRTTIAMLKANQDVDFRALLVKKELLSYKNGNEDKLRLKLDFMDRSGRISGNVWNNPERVYELLEEGQVVAVKATVVDYKGTLTLNIKSMSRVPESEDSPRNYLPVADVDLAQLYTEIKNWIAEVQHDGLRELLRYMFVDGDGSPYPRLFVEGIGGVHHHHAYIGGLLEHTYRVTKLARMFVQDYKLGDDPQRLLDLVTAGALLHDIGKLESYRWVTGFERTDEGYLLEHLVLGVQIVERVLTQDALSGNPRFNLESEIKMRLLHMLVSHHAKPEFGSPVPPQTPEAIVLHLADLTDSQMNKLQGLVTRTGEAEWSEKDSFFGNMVRVYFGA